jgi:phosphatidylinositol alpha-1,6-mannosyltransferase
MQQEKKLKILIITRNLPPLVGGMEKLNWHMADELSKSADVTVIGPTEAKEGMPQKVTFHGVPLKPLWRFILSSAWRAIIVARHLKPDIVLAGRGLTAPSVLIAARLVGARAVTYVHGLDVAVNHTLYKALWHPCLKRLDTVIANSRPTAQLCRALGISSQRISIVHPGVSLPANFATHQHEVAQFKEKYGLHNRKVMLSVGRLTSRKGIREFVQKSLPSIVAQVPNATLLVIGDAPTDSLHAEAQTVESINEVAVANGVAKNILFIGVITDSYKLSTAYYASDVHVFPVRTLAGDPEGFGMVAIEAAAHGLPTVAFNSGGIVDAVSNTLSGALVHAEDYTAFSLETIQTLVAVPSSTRSSKEFAAQFAWGGFGKKLKEILGKAW